MAEAGKTCKKHLVHIHITVVTASNKITVQILKQSFLAWVRVCKCDSVSLEMMHSLKIGVLTSWMSYYHIWAYVRTKPTPYLGYFLELKWNFLAKELQDFGSEQSITKRSKWIPALEDKSRNDIFLIRTFLFLDSTFFLDTYFPVSWQHNFNIFKIYSENIFILSFFMETN